MAFGDFFGYQSHNFSILSRISKSFSNWQVKKSICETFTEKSSNNKNVSLELKTWVNYVRTTNLADKVYLLKNFLTQAGAECTEIVLPLQKQ